MSLLDQLREEEPIRQTDMWRELSTFLGKALPDYKHQKVTLIRGEGVGRG
jgi:hypothetical protein